MWASRENNPTIGRPRKQDRTMIDPFEILYTAACLEIQVKLCDLAVAVQE